MGPTTITKGIHQIQSITLEQSGGAPTNRIATVTNNDSPSNYLYDAAGNVTDDGVHTYTYDAANRLVSVDGGATAQYRYDHKNQRVTKIVGSSWTHYIWEGGQVIGEHDATTTYTTNPPYQEKSARLDYIYARGRMIHTRERASSTAPWTTRYYVSDVWSTRLVLDASGNVLGRQGHLPFGEEFAESGTQEKHHFTSYEAESESSTSYAVNRQYLQSIGRFNSADPYQASSYLVNPQSWNRYSYVENDPIHNVDPLGLLLGYPGPGPDPCCAAGFCGGGEESAPTESPSRTCSIEPKFDGHALLRQNPYQGPTFKYQGLGAYNTRKNKDINNQFWLFFYEVEVAFPNGVGRRRDWRFEVEVNYRSETSALVDGRIVRLPLDIRIGEDDTPYDQNTGWIGNRLYAVDTPALPQWDGTYRYPIVEGRVSFEFTWRVKIGNNTICERQFQMELRVPVDGIPSWVIVR